MKFTLIPAGEFVMGSEESDSEKPVHRVKISKPFYFGTYPVTQKQWRDVMGNDPSYFKGDNLPVEQVSWNDVQEFIKKPNPWGLYDMHGNVWEWVQDNWHADYNGAPTDENSCESGDGSARVNRGGSWYAYARNCRSALCSLNDPGNRSVGLGFRLLRIS